MTLIFLVCSVGVCVEGAEAVGFNASRAFSFYPGDLFALSMLASFPR